MTDYRLYPEFLDEMEAVKVSSAVPLRFIHGEPHQAETYTLLLTETEPTSVLKLKEGPFKVSNGSWILQPTPDGGTHARYSVEVKVAAFVPKSVSSRIVGKTVPALLASFKGRAEKLHA